jgi:hypothetical protein
MAIFASRSGFNGGRARPAWRIAFVPATPFFAACLLLAATTGCSKKSRLAVVPVRGAVTYKGQGVPNALVVFFPVDETADTLKKMRPFGYADDQGKFELKSYVTNDGAPPGKYRVSIVAGPTNSVANGGHDAKPSETTVPKTAVAVPAEIVKKYGNVDTSGLEVTVENGENNLSPFAL